MQPSQDPRNHHANPRLWRGGQVHIHGGGRAREEEAEQDHQVPRGGVQIGEMTRLGNRLVRVSVFGSKSCVFLAVCGQIWPKILGTYALRSS